VLVGHHAITNALALAAWRDGTLADRDVRATAVALLHRLAHGLRLACYSPTATQRLLVRLRLWLRTCCCLAAASICSTLIAACLAHRCLLLRRRAEAIAAATATSTSTSTAACICCCCCRRRRRCALVTCRNLVPKLAQDGIHL
jgi:hypothetical protein